MLIGIPYTFIELNRIKKDNFHQASLRMGDELENCLASKEDVWLTNSLLIANNPIIEQALWEKDRGQAYEVLTHYSEIFQETTNFNNVQIHLIDKDLQSFVKSWDSGHYGESLSYSTAYKETLNSRKPLVVLEPSPKGLRLKGLFPVFHQGELAGLCNFEGGLNSFKRDLADRRIEFLYLLSDQHLDIAESLGNAPRLGSYVLSQKDFNPDFLDYMASLGEPEAGNSYQADRRYLSITRPINNLRGERIGLYILAQDRALIDQGSRRSTRLLLTMLGIALLMIVVMTLATVLFLGRTVLQPVRMLLETSNHLAAGDFSHQVSQLARKDEFKDLLEGHAHAIDSLKQLLQRVQSSSLKNESENAVLIQEIEETIFSIHEINIASMNSSRSMSQLNQMIQSASSAVEEINANINSLASRIESQTSAVSQTTASMEEMSSSINSVARITEKHVHSSEELARMTTEGEEQVKHTLQQINKINDSLDEMSSLNTIVKNVAAQTSLLAMNAAIEAAHAGDAGRGFAVVADEIRKLAESTSESSTQISHSLKSLVDNIAISVGFSETTAELFNRINDKAQLVSQSYSEINSNTEELSLGTKDVVDASELLLRISREIRDSIEEMAKGTGEITQSLLSVKGSSSDMSRKMDFIYKGISQVTSSMDTITGSTLTTSSTLKEMLEQLSAFKVSDEHDRAQQRGREVIYYSILMLQHIRWITKVQGVINGEARIALDELSDHTGCELGRWLGEGREALFSSTAAYDQFLGEHQSLHASLYEIVRKGKSGDEEDLEASYQEFMGHSKYIIDKLRELRN